MQNNESNPFISEGCQNRNYTIVLSQLDLGGELDCVAHRLW